MLFGLSQAEEKIGRIQVQYARQNIRSEIQIWNLERIDDNFFGRNADRERVSGAVENLAAGAGTSTLISWRARAMRA